MENGVVTGGSSSFCTGFVNGSPDGGGNDRVLTNSQSPSAATKNPMWNANLGDLDENSLDNILTPVSGEEESVKIDDNSHDNDNASSPFSELFPSKFLSENGVDMPPTPCPPEQNDVNFVSSSLMNTPFSNQRKVKVKGVKTNFCSHCDSGFTRRSTLNKHIKDKHTPAPIKYCPYSGCNFVTRNPNLMTSHKKIHRFTGKPQYFCRSCKLRYSHRRSLLQHLTRNHGSDASLIGIGAINETSTVSQVSTVEVDPPPQVVKPTRTSSRTSSDSKSTVTSSSNKKPSPTSSQTKPKKSYDCDRCSFSAASFPTLFSHRTREHIQKETTAVNCVYCRKQFASDRLAAHIKSQHKPRTGKQHACTICDFVTSTKRVFTAHMKMHSTESEKTKIIKTVSRSSSASTNNLALTPSNVVTDRLNGAIIPHLGQINSQRETVPEYDACISNLQEANSHLLQLSRRRETQLDSLRGSVMKLLKKFLPSSHPAVQPQTWHLITGENVDRLVTELISNYVNQ